MPRRSLRSQGPSAAYGERDRKDLGCKGREREGASQVILSEASLMSSQHNKPKAPSSLVCTTASLSSLAPLPPSRLPSASAPPTPPCIRTRTRGHRQQTAHSAPSCNLSHRRPQERLGFLSRNSHSALQVCTLSPRAVKWGLHPESADISTPGLPRGQI
ncbi:hypothetical protein K466DRAFT_82257 [Polyporus arcularius HHB13444]|uniref:Uncharacterized protein n=1 Tax=Polyporus arcularius HHB13444 TaxID=1314778 RepID=A0A5C3PVZ5_9APHY|nr:hypothetical protein K466DRAFT_82257 [Polyporus arcularius HHB13444]